MHPTIDLEFIELSFYSVLVLLGLLAGLAVAYLYLRGRSRRLRAPGAFLDSVLVALGTGWVGARAYHVLTHWEYYQARPEEIAQFDLGGLAIRGAFIAAFAGVALYARLRRVSFWHLADAAALALALGQAVGWVGALVHGANYGVISESPPAMDLPDLYGLVQPRFPLQHAEIALFALVFVGLLIMAGQRRRPGSLFLAYLFVVSAANLALGFERGDETLYVYGMRIDQIVDAILAAAGLTGLLAQKWMERRALTRAGDVRKAIGNPSD